MCNSDWGKEAAEIVCREIGCGTPDAQSASVSFGVGTELTGVKTRCYGNESSLAHCSLVEITGGCVDAHIVCSSMSSSSKNLLNATCFALKIHKLPLGNTI